MNNVMLDLETMGSESDAAIVSIGAVQFDPKKGKIGSKFFQCVSLNSSMQDGGTVNGNTIMWWLSQSEEAIKGLTKSYPVSIHVALDNFSEWMKSSGPIEGRRVWGNGAAFDNVILSSAFKRANISRPWTYKGDMCYRTLCSLYPDIPMERNGTHHNSLDDAITQTLHLIKLFNQG